MVEYRRCSVMEIAAVPNMPALIQAYEAESSLPEIGRVPTGKTAQEMLAQYHNYEIVGALHVIGAFDGERIVGFVMVLTHVLPHYAELTAVSESFFVDQDYRKRGVGLRLKAVAKEVAKEKGAKTILWSAPANGAFAKQLHAEAKRGTCRLSNEVFIEALS